jgi:hypothetical protein
MPGRVSKGRLARVAHTHKPGRNAGTHKQRSRTRAMCGHRGAGDRRWEQTVKSIRIVRGPPFAAVIVAVCAMGCAKTGVPDFSFEDDGGGAAANAEGGSEAGSGSGSGSGRGGSGGSGSGSASSSGGAGGSGSGSSSGSASSSGSPVDSGGRACGSCSVDQDCTNNCVAAQAGFVWCCANSTSSATCYQVTACPNPSDGGGVSDASTRSDASGPDAAPNDALCSAMSTTAACQTCCINNHTHGDQTYNAAIQACACGAAGVCQTQCATEYCAGAATAAGDPCANCVNGSLGGDAGGTCINPVTVACRADPDCVALLSTSGCVAGCP